MSRSPFAGSRLLVASVIAFFDTGCGRSELVVRRLARDAAIADAAVADAAEAGDAPACRPTWSSCRATFFGLTVSEDGQLPDVAWDGRELLVAYGTGGGIEVAGVSLEGTVLWREPIGGTQWPRITWNPVSNVGVVVMDSAVRWLDSTGHATGSLVPARVPDSQLDGAAIPTRRGFTLMSGTDAYATPPDLYLALLDPTPNARIDFLLSTSGAPRSPPEFAVGSDGLATFAVSSVWHAMRGEVFPVDAAGVLQPAIPFGMRMLPSSHVAGIAERAGVVYVLSATTNADLAVATITLANDAVEGPFVLGFTAPRANSGHMIRLGDDIVVAGEQSPSTRGVQVGVLDFAIPGGIGTRTVFGGQESQSPRMTATPRGVAVVWNEPMGSPSRLAARVEAFECCEP